MNLRLFAVLLLIFLGTTITLAQDTSDPNDPTADERANACLEGGTMEGKCDSDWTWNCGWYLIRFEYGMFQREVIPTWCSGLLPPLPVITSLIPTMAVGCYRSSHGEFDFSFNGQINTAHSLVVMNSNNGSCTGATAGYGHAMEVYFEGASADALRFCQAIEPAVTYIENSLAHGYPVPNAYFWGCA